MLIGCDTINYPCNRCHSCGGCRRDLNIQWTHGRLGLNALKTLQCLEGAISLSHTRTYSLTLAQSTMAIVVVMLHSGRVARDTIHPMVCRLAYQFWLGTTWVLVSVDHRQIRGLHRVSVGSCWQQMSRRNWPRHCRRGASRTHRRFCCGCRAR